MSFICCFFFGSVLAITWKDIITVKSIWPWNVLVARKRRRLHMVALYSSHLDSTAVKTRCDEPWNWSVECSHNTRLLARVSEIRGLFYSFLPQENHPKYKLPTNRWETPGKSLDWFWGFPMERSIYGLSAFLLWQPHINFISCSLPAVCLPQLSSVQDSGKETNVTEGQLTDTGSLSSVSLHTNLAGTKQAPPRGEAVYSSVPLCKAL